MIDVSSIVEPNGKTWKENNLNKNPTHQLGSLVELNWEDGKYNGVRLFVVGYERDCDGQPLYKLSVNSSVCEEISSLNLRILQETYLKHNKWRLVKNILYNKMSNLEGQILSGIGEESLTLVEATRG